MSSRKTRTNLSKYLLKTLFIRHINVAGAFVRPNGNHYKLIMPIPCPEGCLMNVFILDSYLMVTRPQVNLGKYLCSPHLIKEVIDPRERIFILHSNLVQLFVINTQLECTIFLLYKQNWCSLRRHTWSDICNTLVFTPLH